MAADSSSPSGAETCPRCSRPKIIPGKWQDDDCARETDTTSRLRCDELAIARLRTENEVLRARVVELEGLASLVNAAAAKTIPAAGQIGKVLRPGSYLNKTGKVTSSHQLVLQVKLDDGDELVLGDGEFAVIAPSADFEALTPGEQAQVLGKDTPQPDRCYYCKRGFPLKNGIHAPTQALGMIPNTLCEAIYPVIRAAEGVTLPPGEYEVVELDAEGSGEFLKAGQRFILARPLTANSIGGYGPSFDVVWLGGVSMVHSVRYISNARLEPIVDPLIELHGLELTNADIFAMIRVRLTKITAMMTQFLRLVSYTDDPREVVSYVEFLLMGLERHSKWWLFRETSDSFRERVRTALKLAWTSQ